MLMNRNLFPLGKAYGQAFCNRVKETGLLVGNIKSGKHTLLIAPRRYGKSSLAEKAIELSKIPAETANFHLCTSEEEVAAFIKKICTDFIGHNIGKISALLPMIQSYLKTLTPRVSFFKDTATLELVSSGKENYAIAISETLLMLDKLLGEHNKRGVFFFDEFQEIAHIKQHGNIEGAIRTAAQEMQNLSIIFSGSIRSLLVSMFEDESRPLYKLCRKIHLDRISAEDYIAHIQSIAKETWGEHLASQSMTLILELSNRHPYYINYLCDSIWQLADSLPNEAMIQTAWKQVLTEEWSDAVREISLLPMTQRKILKHIAPLSVAQQLTSQNTARQLRLAASSIASALNALIEKDYLEFDAETDRYIIINPLLRALMDGVEH